MPSPPPLSCSLPWGPPAGSQCGFSPGQNLPVLPIALGALHPFPWGMGGVGSKLAPVFKPPGCCFQYFHVCMLGGGGGQHAMESFLWLQKGCLVEKVVSWPRQDVGSLVQEPWLLGGLGWSQVAGQFLLGGLVLCHPCKSLHLLLSTHFFVHLPCHSCNQSLPQGDLLQGFSQSLPHRLQCPFWVVLQCPVPVY